jgi:hypothetical protein
MRVPPVFDDNETAILTAMYNAENGTYTSCTLALKLNPTVEDGTPSASEAFSETRSATERLIAHDLVRGERHSGADGVYFNKLKLTAKGVRAAIQAMQNVEDKKAFEKAVEQVNSLLPPPPWSRP